MDRKWFRVTMPITGKVSIDVEADNEEDAIDQAGKNLNISCIEDWCEDDCAAEVEELVETDKASS